MSEYAEIVQELTALGYILQRHGTDAWGHTWPFWCAPMGSGSLGHFRTLAEVKVYIKQIREARGYYQE
jgi:hypothetical protein